MNEQAVVETTHAGLTHKCDDPACHVPGFVVTLGRMSEDSRGAMMDRPAYELVRLLEAALDDADQITDTPQAPNRIAVWGIRMLLEPYGGKPHRWQWPLCFECDHQMPLHNYGPCGLCGCAITPEEIADGARDEALDESIEQALRIDTSAEAAL